MPLEDPSNVASEGDLLAPADFDLSISGYYGPGSLACWYLIVIALVLSWCFLPQHRFKLTNDFVAAMAYPLIAVGHLLVQVCAFPGDKTGYIAANITHLSMDSRNRYHPRSIEAGRTWDYPGSATWDEYPRFLALDAALRVSDLFGSLCVTGLTAMFFYFDAVKVPHGFRDAATVIAGLLLGVLWAGLVGFILMVRIGGAQSIIVPCMAMMAPVMSMMMLWLNVFFVGAWLAPVYFVCRLLMRLYSEVGSVAGVPGALGRWVVMSVKKSLRWAFIASPWKLIYRWFFVYAGCCWAFMLGYAAPLAAPLLLAEFPYSLFFPKTGISIRELDQAAALVGGLLTLAMNIRSIVEERKTAKAAQRTEQHELEEGNNEVSPAPQGLE